MNRVFIKSIFLFCCLFCQFTMASDVEKNNLILNTNSLSNDNLITKVKAQSKIITVEQALESAKALLATGVIARVIPAAAFSSDNFEPENFFFDFFNGVMSGNSNGIGCVKTSVNIPENNTIEKLSITVIDNSTSNLLFRLYRVQNFDGTVDVLSSITTTGASAAFQIFENPIVSNNFVDSLNYSYYIGGCLVDANTSLLGIRVFYDTTIFSNDFE